MGQKTGALHERPRGLAKAHGPSSATLAIVLLVFQAIGSENIGEALFGPWAPLFWIAWILWLATSLLALRARQYWWVVPAVPVAIFPLFPWLTLVIQCSRGNCL